ncbi:MAG: hypothetical protein ACD_8C00101G0009 [uncultured bacterium]|nr:MAG: hypothetical protein ACD_8C00101G0009 [uncultured bacterium]
MQTKTKIKKSKNKNIVILVAILTVGVFFAFKSIEADDTSIVDGLSQQTTKEQDENDKKIEELEKRAEIYRDIIDIKKKQSETLNDQLSVTDSNIAHVQTLIDINKKKIDDFNSQILRIEKQIKEKEELMELQKKVLSKMMQSYYEASLSSPVVVYLNDDNLASFIIKKDRIAQTSDKMREMVISVKNIKAELEVQSEDVEKKKEEVVSARENLDEKNEDLESIKAQKENLLAQTKGEEARYQQLLARVEAQKQELLNIDQLYSSGSFSIGGLSASEYIKKNEPPSSLFSSTSWYYSQKDPRWATVNIGNSKTTDMANWGCAVTSVAMVSKFYGDSITPGQLAKKPIYDFDLIKWQINGWSSAEIELDSKYGSSHGNISWSAIDAAIKNKKPVIIYIGKSGGGGGHYVVVHGKDSKTGKYVVHDPYFGANIYLDTSRALVGAGKKSTGTYMDQMIIYN